MQRCHEVNHGRKPLKRLKEAQLPERRLVYTMLTRSRETLVIPESLWEALGECCEVLGGYASKASRHLSRIWSRGPG